MHPHWGALKEVSGLKEKRIGTWAEDAVVCGIRGDCGWGDVRSGDD